MWKWENVPVPAQHLVGLLLGAILHLVFGGILIEGAWVGTVSGLLLVVIGIGLAAWAVVEAGETEVRMPGTLMTRGPHAFSRNPMYVARTLMHLGIGLIENSPFVVAGLPMAVIFTHFVDVRNEERFLQKRFGDEYLQYKSRVRRYI